MVWKVRKSNAETRMVKDVVVKRETKNDDGSPKSVNARVATISNSGGGWGVYDRQGEVFRVGQR